ncbi:MAG TPA: hypothetical protein VJJ80_00845 [Patescibacteria group bacterium]|nr:hypothetical protein [Patescibacteria group bacterium]
MKKFPTENSKRLKSTKLSKNNQAKTAVENTYLETQRAHNKWYLANAMGKQLGKPRLDMAGKKIKKAKKDY